MSDKPRDAVVECRG